MSKSCAPKCDPAKEPLNSALDNFILAFFGSVTKTCVNNQVVWSLPCDLDSGIAGFPRVAGEGVACYLLRIFGTGATGSGTTTLNFTQPAVGGSVTITVNNPTSFQAGQTIIIPGVGTYTVTSVGGSSITATLEPNPETPPGGTVPSGSTVVIVNATSGFSGTIAVVTDVAFNSPDLVQTKVTKTYVNGVLWSISSPSTSTITTAVSCP